MEKQLIDWAASSGVPKGVFTIIHELIEINLLDQAIYAVAMAVLFFFVAIIFRRVLISQAARIASGKDGEWEDFAAGLIRRIRSWVLMVLAIAIGSRWLTLTSDLEASLQQITGIGCCYSRRA